MRRIPLSSVAWAALLAAIVAWAALLLSAPLLGRGTAGGRVGPAVAAAVYLSGGLVCHHRPERSFHLAGAQLPVCGRCTGLYLSTAAGVLFAVMWHGGRRHTNGERKAALPHRSWFLAAAVPSFLTLVLEWSGAWPVSNLARAAAAAPLGLVLGARLVEAAGFRGRL